MAHFGGQSEMDYQRKRLLRFAVLGHLRLSSATQWDSLCIHFAMSQDEEVETILKDLRNKKYVEVGKDRMVRITASGRQHLAEHFYLRGDA